MAYLTQAELKTHMREEIVDKITRNDDTIVETAIAAGIAEAKSYLGKYNTTALLGDTPTVTDVNLKMKVKDLACWHLVKLCNPNISVAMFRTAYEDAIEWLINIMKGQSDPEGWTYKTDDADTDRTEGQGFSYNSNTKRTNHW